MGPSLCPSEQQHQPPCPTDEEEEEEDEFEFRPLLPQPRRPRIGGRRVAAQACKVATDQPAGSSHQPARRAPAPKSEPAPPQRRVRWHHMAFGSVRVPSAMDMGEIRRRLRARQALANEPSAAAAAGWAPWRLIRSLSCKGVEAVAVAAAAAPVRLV